MSFTRRAICALAVVGVALSFVSAFGQTVVGTVNAGTTPVAAAANIATNMIYTANYGSNNVTVINGATLQTSTVTAGQYPYDVRVNPFTNKIYVSNFCGNDSTCQSNGTVTVIDGATNKTTTVNVGMAPYQAAVNTNTNKIYVANSGGNTVSIIDGATNQTTSVTVGNGPSGLAVNPVTNKIYVPNFADNTITVIDGATLATDAVAGGGYPVEAAVNYITNQIYVANMTGNSVTVIDGATNNTSTVNVDLNPSWLAVNQVTNKIYTANFGSNTVTEIDGATLNPTSITVGNSPSELVVDPATNKIYVANFADNTATTIDGATHQTTTTSVGNGPGAIEADIVNNRVYVANYGDNTVTVVAGANAAPLQFVAVAPCRVVDTRGANGEFGGPPLQGQQTRNFPIPANMNCNIPSTAAAYSLNVTVVPHGTLGYLTVWPTGEDQPLVSTLNSDGRVKANAAIVPAGYQGGISFFVTNTTDLVLDIDGYFAPVSQSTLAFYPLPPCRIVDTRGPNGPLGGPFLVGGVNRDFPVLMSNCGLPQQGAQAYSFNITALPHEAMGYITLCPTPSNPNQSCPLVSTLNWSGGQDTANAAIVPAGTGGSVRVNPSDNTDLLIDVNGYFAAPAQGGLSLYPVVPCRVLDTRPHPFQFELNPPVDVLGSVCAPSSQSQAYVFNATVVPQGGLGFLTLWPDGIQQPVVSTLNAFDGAITSNMAIVPAGKQNGKVDAYASPLHQNDQNDVTNLILDISSYFAP